MLESFLQELEVRGLFQGTPDLQERLGEAREHLLESIAAREELGDSPEEAEREAIAMFGASKDWAGPFRCPVPSFTLVFFAGWVGIAWFSLITWSGLEIADTNPLTTALGLIAPWFVAILIGYLPLRNRSFQRVGMRSLALRTALFFLPSVLAPWIVGENPQKSSESIGWIAAQPAEAVTVLALVWLVFACVWIRHGNAMERRAARREHGPA